MAMLVGAIAVLGCASEEPWRYSQPYGGRLLTPPESPPEIRHCTDPVGHIPGTYPYIYGGTCCCNPSPKLLDAYHRDGYLLEWGEDALYSAYRGREIATTRDHQGCNNLCEYGPHLVRGGRCLVPPTPGTLNFEEVLTGHFSWTPREEQRVAELGGPYLPQPGDLELRPGVNEPVTAARGAAGKP